jgi:hypothetical protein
VIAMKNCILLWQKIISLWALRNLMMNDDHIKGEYSQSFEQTFGETNC